MSLNITPSRMGRCPIKELISINQVAKAHSIRCSPNCHLHLDDVGECAFVIIARGFLSAGRRTTSMSDVREGVRKVEHVKEDCISTTHRVI